MKKVLFFTLTVVVLLLGLAAVTSAETAPDSAFTMRNGASVRTGGETGIRFLAKLNRTYYNELLSSGNVSSVRKGMLIAPEQYIETAGGVFTAEAFDAAGLEYLEMLSTDWYRETETEYIISGSVVDIIETHYLLKYSAVAFIELTFESGGSRRIYACGYFGRSPYEVALAAKCDGDESVPVYYSGVADIKKTGASQFSVRSTAEILNGINDVETNLYVSPYTCRSDSRMNIWIMSDNGTKPDMIFLDGEMVAKRVGNSYSVDTAVISSVSSETGGVLLSLKCPSPFEGLTQQTAEVTGSLGKTVLTGVTVRQTKVYTGPAVTKDEVKYYILQSCCSDGKYIYYIQNKKDNLTNMLVKAELETGKIVARTFGNSFDHGNGITYNVRTDELVIVHNDNGTTASDNKKWITVVDAGTLAVKEKRMLADKLYSVEYDAVSDSYLFGIAGTYNHRRYTSSFTPTSDMCYGISNSLTKQDMTLDGSFVIFPQYKTSGGKYYNFLSLFDRTYKGNNASYIGLVDMSTEVQMEIEDCFFIAGQLYTVYYKSGDGVVIYRADIEIK